MFSRWGHVFCMFFFKKIHECITMFQEEIHTNLLFKVKALRLLDLCTDVFLTVWNPKQKQILQGFPIPWYLAPTFFLTKNRSRSLLNQKLVFAQHTVYIRRGLLTQFCCWNFSKLPVFKQNNRKTKKQQIVPALFHASASAMPALWQIRWQWMGKVNKAFVRSQ